MELNYLISVLCPSVKVCESVLKRAEAKAEKHIALTKKEPAEELKRLGFKVKYADLSFPGVLVWGRVNIAEKTVYADLQAAEVLIKRSEVLGDKRLNSDSVLKLILAHELFHILEPHGSCEDAELAAVIFSFKSAYSAD